MILLNIVIVNWNGGDTLKKCLIAVFNSSLDKELYNVFVVDNNSSDNSLDIIDGLSTNLTIIKNKTNIGFGSACNIVLKNYPSEFVLILNPDVFVNKDSLDESLTFMKNRTDIDILGVKNFNTSDQVSASCARFPSVGRYINDILGLSKVAPGIFRPGTIMSDWDHLDSRMVDHVIGAYMMIRYSILKESGLFDEDFFLYMEDVDLTYRIHKSGGLCYYNSEISVIHEGGGTTKGIRATSLSYSLQSRIIYCKKHFKLLSTLLIIILSSVIEPFIRIIKLCLSLNFKDFFPLISAYRKYYKWLITEKRE
jgi:GT2 family glycosyltransferase